MLVKTNISWAVLVKTQIKSAQDRGKEKKYQDSVILFLTWGEERKGKMRSPKGSFSSCAIQEEMRFSRVTA